MIADKRFKKLELSDMFVMSIKRSTDLIRKCQNLRTVVGSELTVPNTDDS